MSVPRRRTNGTAPGRVACQSLREKAANRNHYDKERKVFLCMAEKQSFMRVDEVAQELGVSKSMLQDRTETQCGTEKPRLLDHIRQSQPKVLL